MKTNIMKKLLSVAVLAAMSGSVYAQGTTAGTTIDNTASITYNVGSVPQTVIKSSPTGSTDATGAPTQFLVDKKIDLTVTGGSTALVPTNAPAQATTFTVQNTGNSNENFTLATAQVATAGTADVFDTSTCTIEVAGAVVTQVPLTADETKTITVKCTTPANDGTTVIDGAKSQIDLKATAIDPANSNAPYQETATDDAMNVDVVLADANGTVTDNGARNASHSAVNTYQIATADIKVKKLSTVVWDPYNNGTNPKRIPGAHIKYTITVENTGSASATNINVSDNIPANMTYIATDPNDATVTACTADSGGACSFAANAISATNLTVAAGATGTVTFYVKVN